MVLYCIIRITKQSRAGKIEKISNKFYISHLSPLGATRGKALRYRTQ